MALEGASVQESVPLKERSSALMREADILIEYELAGGKFRIAIECRDRSRKDDISWIDALIGKYGDLDIEINKVVAVSRSGFSEPAKKKALAKNIKTMTLAKALTSKWPLEFIKLGMVGLTLNTTLERFRVEAAPGLTEKLQKSDSVTDSTGKAIATIGDIVNGSYPKVKNKIRVYLKQLFFELFHTLSDLHKSFRTEQSFPLSSSIYLIDTSGVSHRIQSITFTAISKFSVKRVPVEHYTFGEDEALVTTAVLGFADSEDTHALKVIQIPGKEQMTVSVKSFKKKKARA